MNPQIIHGDCLDVLPAIAPKSVQCVVTSPPYFGLRDYGLPPSEWPALSIQTNEWVPPSEIEAWRGCLGLEPHPLMYVAHLVYVFRLVREVLADDGVVWLNLGDSYANDTKRSGSTSGKHARALHGEWGISRNRHNTGIASKCLMGIPWLVAFALRADGWYLRSDVIWHKPNAMPESVQDRPTKDHEYLFLLAKSERYFYDAVAIKEPAATTDPQKLSFERKRGKNTQASMPGATAQHRPTRKQDAVGKTTYTGFNDRYTPSPTRNRRTVWSVNTQPLVDAHYAPMPTALVVPCVLAGSREGDTVLDPFGGSGTVAKVAVREGRKAISIDLNTDYIDIQHSRTAQRALWEVA